MVTQGRHIKARRAPTRLLVGGLAAVGLWIAMLSAIALASPVATDDFESGELFFDSLVIADEDKADSVSTPPARPASSTSLIVLDGEFHDWEGQANIVDSASDASKQRGDILAFYWGDNESETMFWMVERATEESTKLVIYSVHLDMNNNGDFNDDVDRIIEVQYQPRADDSRVDVKVRRADDNFKLAEYENRDWGESEQEGGSRVEFGVSVDDLEFSFGAAFRMYVESNFNDRAPDTGDIQWSPMPILGYVGLGLVLGLGGVAIWWFRLRRYEGNEVPRT